MGLYVSQAALVPGLVPGLCYSCHQGLYVSEAALVPDGSPAPQGSGGLALHAQFVRKKQTWRTKN